MRRMFAGLTCLATLGGGLIFYSQAGQAQDNRPCNSNSEQCMISAATTYLDALVSHDATNVRLAPDARRTEEGFDTGDGATPIKQSVSLPTPDESIIVNRRLKKQQPFQSAHFLEVFQASPLNPRGI